METIEVFSKEEKESTIRAVTHMIEKARRLNKEGEKSVSNRMTGTDFLHGLLVEGTIDMRMYISLIRVAEDPKCEYEVVL